mgnify:CR=1 FL=1
MIKKRLKYKYLFLFAGVAAILSVLAIGMTLSSDLKVEDNDDYMTEEVINDSQPVINTAVKVINPYLDSGVKIGKNYYDYKGSEETQINSILKHDNTYTQNTGIDFICENEFDVISVLDGTVTDVKDDENLGKSIEIKHENGLITSYQSLGEINVKKGDIITQGQVIGKSGENELDKELGNHLHFEIYENGGNVDPNNYLNKEIPSKKEN